MFFNELPAFIDRVFPTGIDGIADALEHPCLGLHIGNGDKTNKLRLSSKETLHAFMQLFICMEPYFFCKMAIFESKDSSPVGDRIKMRPPYKTND